MATLELTTLGTGSPMHFQHRYGNSQVVSGGGVNILIDAGWGATIRMFQASMPPQSINAVLVTHLHSDHTTDFADFLVMGWVGGRQAPIPIYGPAGTARMIAGYQQALEADTKYRMDHHGDKLPAIGPAADVKEFSVGEQPEVITKIGDITVKAFEVDHWPVKPAYGYRIEREDKVIAISGDTKTCPGLVNGAMDADVLVAEAMSLPMMQAFEQRLRSIGNDNQAALLEDAHSYHTPLDEMAAMAAKARVKHLLLTHVMPPIPEEQIPQFVQGMDAIFGGKISVAKDLDKLSI